MGVFAALLIECSLFAVPTSQPLLSFCMLYRTTVVQ